MATGRQTDRHTHTHTQREREREIERAGSFQPREDPHDSNGRIQREIDFSLPTQLSGRNIASATQVTRDGSGHTGEERAAQVNTAG